MPIISHISSLKYSLIIHSLLKFFYTLTYDSNIKIVLYPICPLTKSNKSEWRFLRRQGRLLEHRNGVTLSLSFSLEMVQRSFKYYLLILKTTGKRERRFVSTDKSKHHREVDFSSIQRLLNSPLKGKQKGLCYRGVQAWETLKDLMKKLLYLV